MTFELQQYLMNRSRHFLSKNHFVVEDVMKTLCQFIRTLHTLVAI